MVTENALMLWLVYAAVAATFFLVVGALAVCVRTQQVERLRLIQWAMVACLLAPLANQLPGLPRWSLAWPTTLPQPIARVNDAMGVQAQSQPLVHDQETSATKIQDSTHNKTPIEQRPSEPINAEPPNVAEAAASSSIAADALQNKSQPAETPTISKPAPAVQSVALSQSPVAVEHWSWPRIVLVLYAAGVGIMFAWYAIGFFTLAWLNWTARAVPDEVAKLFRSAVADPAALKVRLCMHRRVELPLAFGLLRPTILLPEQMRMAGDQTALRYSLVHEWSHLARGDVLRWRLSTCVNMLFFYQPLAWWLRRQLRLCQDYLADSHAAGEAAAREDYAQFLVSLAHRRLGLPGTLALSVGDGRSNLYRRVTMLLENRQPLAQHLRWPRRLAIATAAIALIALSSAIRLTADESQPTPEPAAQARAAAATPRNQPPSNSKSATDETAGAVICTGEVRDALVGKPIAGAKITIQKLGKPDGVSLKQFETETNADGKYSFELPTDHAWQETRNQFSNRRITVNLIPLEVEIKRSGYAPLRRLRDVELNGTPSADADDSATESAGFSVSRPSINAAKQKPIDLFELRPGQEVTGTVDSPDGKPVPGVKVFAHSMVPKNERSIPVRPPSARQTGIRTVPASEDETQTDANGKFRVTMISPGEGMIWFTPETDYAPQARVLYDQRGDLGAIKLERGSKVEGRIVDVEGKPLAGVYVSAYPWNIAEPQYSGNVEQQVHRAAETDAQGKFTLGPLAPGEYRVEPQEFLDSHPAILRHTSRDQRALPAMFLPHKLTLTDDYRAAQVEMRAVPTVTVEGRVYNGGNVQELVRSWNRRVAPSSIDTPPPVIIGKIDGLTYRAVPQAEGDGGFKFTMPKGLTDARLNISPYRNRTPTTQPRWRLGPDKPINSDASIILGAIDENVGGIEIDYASRSQLSQPFGPDAGDARVRGSARGRGAPPAPAGADTAPSPPESKSDQSFTQPYSEPAAQAKAAESPPAAQPSKPPATADAATQPETKPTPQGSDKPTPNSATPDEFTYTGTVQEKDPSTLTEGMSGDERRDLNRFNARQQQEQLPGKPIAGARVHLQFFDVDASIPPKRTPGKEVDLLSDANGKFTFKATADKVNQGRLGFTIEASHPGFIPRGRSGFPNMLRPPDAPVTGIGALARPLEIDMLPAKSLSGVVVSPEGKPVAGVGLHGYSRPGTWQNGFCYDSATSDEHGRFELPMTATGDGVLWIQPAKDFIPMREEVGNKRGDLGTITLQLGITLKGQLLNAEGAPRPGVEMWAERRDYKRPENAIDNGARFQQYVTTDAQGDFVFAPLPPGEYRVDLAWTSEQQELRSRYLPQTITLAADQEPAPVEMRERFNPDVTVRITGHIEISKRMLADIVQMRALVRTTNAQRFAGTGIRGGGVRENDVDSPEKALQLFAPTVRGTNNGVSASAKGDIDAEGNFTIHAPRGLQQSVIELASAPTIIGLTRTGGSSRSQRNTNDEQVRFFQPQWRLDKDKLWTTGSEIVVGAVGGGLDGIEAKYPETEKLRQFTAVGTVQDESTGQPIAGARIVASLNNGGGHTQLGEVVTDAAGKFAVAIPVGAIMNRRVDQPAFTQTMFGLTLDVKHPEFASPRTPGDMLQLSISPVPELRLMSAGSRGSNGEGPVALQPIYMRPGQRVTGALQLPDGKPAAGILVQASTLTPIGERLRNSRSLMSTIDIDGDKQRYGGENQVTDEAGRFKFVLPSEGDAILAIWPAKVYAPIIKEIHEQRGDLGIVNLEPGDAIKGRVVDVENKPLAGIYVNAEPIGSDDKRGTVRTGRSIDYVNRAAVTDANGDFEMAPLGPGEYRVELRDSATDLTTDGLQEAPAQRKPLPDLFVPQKVTLVAGQRPAPMVFRPPETVVVEGQVRFKRSNPASGIVANSFARYKPKVVGTVNGLEFSAATSIDADGKFTAKVPKGATDVQFELPNRDGPQIRAGKDKPLVDPGAISLGTVNDDVHGVEIVYP